MALNEDNGNGNGAAAPAATPKEQIARTQAIIRSLHEISTSEYLTPSNGEPYLVSRDPHLRLRRTLAPSLNVGIPKYAEAQMMLSKEETTGKRTKLEFGARLDGPRREFTMDSYVWGASEAEAEVRMVTLHGISPGVSRTRWHKLGERYSSSKKVRFVALDWHSIDRSVDDENNVEYLTCLPKHLLDVSPDANYLEEMMSWYPTDESREKMGKLLAAVKAGGICPRGLDDAATILRAVIEEGLGWGTDNTPFVLGVKSWSGGVGMRMLAQLHRDGGSDRPKFAGAVIMHPGCFDKRDIEEGMASGIVPKTLMCWAKDDPLVPYPVSELYKSAGGDKVKLVTYESGGHHNFDGTGSLPNFDDEVMKWIETL
ncbi:hypothetical protein ACHAXT_006540 [Thalassiosira profunda]